MNLVCNGNPKIAAQKLKVVPEPCKDIFEVRVKDKPKAGADDISE